MRNEKKKYEPYVRENEIDFDAERERQEFEWNKRSDEQDYIDEVLSHMD
jgi:hypothetical protein